MALDLGSVMDGLGVRLETISGLRVFDYTPDSASPPFAVVSLPDEVAYDFTKAGGLDQATVPVHVLVSRVTDRGARDRLVPYVSSTGASSVKAAIEGDVSLGGASDTVRVETARISVMSVGGVEWLAATFNVDVVA